VKPGANLHRNNHSDCDSCIYRDHPIVIAGSRRFSVEILANYICTNTPAKWEIVEKLTQIPRIDASATDEWRLIFIDCLGLTSADIQTLLETDGVAYLRRDIIALFNLTHGNTDFPTLIDLGVRGFFFESDHAEFILKGICALKNGELWVARGTLMEYVSQQTKRAPQEKQLAGQLTPREKEVLILLAGGATNEKIASNLFISTHTVKTHIYNIMKKLGTENRLQAALWAVKHLQ